MSNEVSFHDLRSVKQVPETFLGRAEVDLSAFIERVKPTIAAVKTEGDAALIRFAHEFDHVRPGPMALRVSDAEFAAAQHALGHEMVATLEFAIDNVRRFHTAQLPDDMRMQEIRPGVWTGDRAIPIDTVACYIPRGKGAFPSVATMTCVPAVVAGVRRAVIITPPGPDGCIDPATLVAARLIGIREVYKCGGAQGIAAVAYGTETVPRCLKVVGPGGPYVVAAKRVLAEDIDPGIPAGPSEAIILADDSVEGALAALDLTIESEHGPDSSAYLVTSSERVAREAREALPRYWSEMDAWRSGFSKAVLCGTRGGILLLRDLDAAVNFVNDFAPEHLEILTREPMAVLGGIRNAGEILLGAYTPITLANYVLGPNAVLPTSRFARTHSALSVHDFMKRTSVAYVTEGAYAALAEPAHRFATYEGFSAHARAVSDLRKPFLKP